MPGLPYRPAADGIRLSVRLTPRGGRDRLENVVEIGGRAVLRARVASPPAEGAANAALVRLVAKTLGLAPSAVTIAAGQSARVKTLVIAGDPEMLAARLDRAIGADRTGGS